jgi:hypothetical protein
MADKIIKVRLFTWFENVPSAIDPNEETRVERISHYGEKVDITDEASLQRGEELDAFFSDEEAAEIEEGNYPPEHATLLSQAYGETLPVNPSGVEDLEGEGPQTGDLSSDELGDYIYENKLNVDETVALAQDGDVDSINKVLDAEDHAAQKRGNDPRQGVVSALEAKLTAASE